MEPLTIPQILAPLYFATLVVGAVPVAVKNGQIAVSKPRILQTIAILILFFVVAIFYVQDLELVLDEELSKIKTITFVLILQDSGGIVVMILVIGVSVFGPKKLQAELDKIMEVDAELVKMGQEKEIVKAGYRYRKTSIILIVLVDVGFNILGTTFLVFSTILSDNKLLHFVIIAYPRLVVSSMNLFFYVMMMILEDRFKMINGIILKKMKESRQMRRYPLRGDFCDEISNLTALHKTLTKISRNCNSVFSIHLLLWIAICFGSLIGDLYIGFYVVLFKLSFKYWTFLINITKNVAMCTFDLFYITKRSSDLCIEANCTKNHLVSIKIDVSKENERNVVSFTSWLTFQVMKNFR